MTRLGAPNIYYLNINATFAGATEAELLAKLDDARMGDGLVIGTAFNLPVAVLVGPLTQSAAEHATALMMTRPGLRIVGRQTSGSNGNVTSVLLPGGFGLAFTGMRLRYPDGSPFHGVGVPITHPSSPTVDDLAAGNDRELLDAIGVVSP